MRKALFLGRALTVCVILAAIVSKSAQAATTALPTTCATPLLSQPFLSIGDLNYYTLLPGQTPDNFDGTGWVLTNGAKLVTAKLSDGQTGQVLDLPSGARAVSPVMCVNASDYPQARTMVADLTGTQGVQVNLQYYNGTWGAPLAAGNVKNTYAGFAASKPIMLHSPTLVGVHLAQFTLVGTTNASGSTGEYQVYDFYVDPRMKW